MVDQSARLERNSAEPVARGLLELPQTLLRERAVVVERGRVRVELNRTREVLNGLCGSSELVFDDSQLLQGIRGRGELDRTRVLLDRLLVLLEALVGHRGMLEEFGLERIQTDREEKVLVGLLVLVPLQVGESPVVVVGGLLRVVLNRLLVVRDRFRVPVLPQKGLAEVVVVVLRALRVELEGFREILDRLGALLLLVECGPPRVQVGCVIRTQLDRPGKILDGELEGFRAFPRAASRVVVLGAERR